MDIGSVRRLPQHSHEHLRTVYGMVEPLGSFLRHQFPAEMLRWENCGVLSNLLRSCIVAQDPALDRQGLLESSCSRTSSQVEVIHRVIEQIFATSPDWQPENVLALGFCRPRVGGTSCAIFHGVRTRPVCLLYWYVRCHSCPRAG